MPPEHQPYTALAEIYDLVMSHVDYDAWARYVATLIGRYAKADSDILELGCGTGNLTIRLVPDFGQSYRATDNSADMLAVAKSKLDGYPGIQTDIVDFRKVEGHDYADVVILAYDGINYAQDLDELSSTMEGIARVLRPDGIFLFDQSTPANSINNLSYFDDHFVGDGFSYSRTSSYDQHTKLHVTCFAIESGGKILIERHEQRAFTRKEMLRTLNSAGFEVLASLEAFDFESADDDSERIQWVLRKPETTNPAV